MSAKDNITNKLREAFAPESLDVADKSHLHEGHAGHRPGGETHFRVYIVSPAFEGKSRIERHRMINAVLAAELAAPCTRWRSRRRPRGKPGHEWPAAQEIVRGPPTMLLIVLSGLPGSGKSSWRRACPAPCHSRCFRSIRSKRRCGGAAFRNNQPASPPMTWRSRWRTSICVSGIPSLPMPSIRSRRPAPAWRNLAAKYRADLEDHRMRLRR